MQLSAKAKIAVFITLLILMLYFGYKNVAQTSERQLLLQNTQAQSNLAALSDSELRLLLLVEEIRVNPHFSLSATNLEHLDQVINELEADRERYKELYSEPKDKENIGQHMLPIDFLRQLAATERHRRHVLQNPSHEAAYQYLNELDLTASTYQEYIIKVESLLTKFELFPIGFIDGFVKRDDLNNWLTGLLEASKTTQEWITLKKVCLEQYQSPCGWEVDEPTLSVPRVEHVIRPDNASLEFINYFIDNENRNSDSNFNEQTATKSAVVFHGQCSSTGSAHNARLWRNKFGDMGLPYVRFLYEDDIMFFDHVANAYFFSALMIEKGIPYQYQPVNHYLCYHHEDDLSTLTVAEAVLEYVNDRPDYSTKTNDPSFSELLAMENELRTSTTSIVMSDVVAYMDKVNVVLETDLSQDDREQLQALVLAYRDRSTYFAQRLNLLNKVLDPVGDSFAQAVVPNSFYIAVIHSALPMTLQSYNQTVNKNVYPPVSTYEPPNQYPNLIKGLDALQNKEFLNTDPINYLEHTLDMLDRVQKGTL